MRCIRRRIPMLSWLVSDPGYNWKEDLTQDIFAGATISAVIIPQSMAYAMLASMPPVHGLYTSLVPTILYTVLGTSRHMSTGTFAITSLLLGQFAHKIIMEQGYSDTSGSEYQRRYLALCLMLTFFVGAIQILISMARLGRWISKHMLPIALVSGFNTASAFHIGTHQLKHWLGMNPPREGGIFSMIKTWIWFIQHFWEDVAWPSLGLGTAAMMFMYVLQRIEYRRRSVSDLVNGPPLSFSSPSPSPASASFPYCQSPVTSMGVGPPSAAARTCHNRLLNVTGASTDKHSKRGQYQRNIVPRAVSDQALLTAQDIELEDEDQSCDSNSSPSWTPVITPSLESDAMIPSLNLHTSNSQSSCLSTPECTRPANTTSVGSTILALHDPASPMSTGLTNTGAFGHRQERTRPQKLSPSPRTYRYKTFRSPASAGNTNAQIHPVSEDEQGPLLARGRFAAIQVSSQPSSESMVGPSRESEQYPSGSSASSVVFTGYEPRDPADVDQHNSLLSRFIPRVHFPIPDIFICVVVFTVATVAFDLDKQYGIEVIGYIPTGLPTLAWPPTMIEAWSTNDWVLLLWPSFLMAIIIYVMSLSVAKHFGREYGYEVDADQEMLALGVGSLVGSCFGGYACTGNLTRSAILAQLGAKTPLASLVGAFMVLMTLLWFTPLFERIPNTILAAIVLVALKSLLLHALEAKRLWRVGRQKDALIWWVTFISVIVFSIEIGLAIGMATVVFFKLYKHGSKWRKAFARSVKQSATYQRLMLMLGLQSPLFTTAGRGLYTGDDEDDY
ncbi:hypothetical protein BGX27_010885 [Mortierella sp. AM989]|nr:hypothetical protein BGX27_010885 [Mortierella sp. AM989]